MSPKVLVVDDEPDVCESISHFLGKRGYDVITATSGKEAILKLLGEKPALILLDIRMPEMDGLECLRIIKQLDTETLIIMVTCVDELDTAKKAMELGAIDYITKPLGFGAIETAISTYLFLSSVK